MTQTEPTEFSKNGVFHSKAVVITFSNCLDIKSQLYPMPGVSHKRYTYKMFGQCDFTPI